MEKTFQGTVLRVLDAETPKKFSEIREAFPKVAPNSISQALNALKTKALVQRIMEGNTSLWLRTDLVGKESKTPSKRQIKKAAAKVEQAVPMPAQIVHHLNLRVYKKERAISFDIEGFSIKIGFIE